MPIKRTTKRRSPTTKDLFVRIESIGEILGALSQDIHELKQQRPVLAIDYMGNSAVALQMLQLSDRVDRQLSERSVPLSELARALLLSRERCDAAIRLAIHRYLDVIGDKRRLAECGDYSDSNKNPMQKILQRYLAHFKQDLDVLGVEIRSVQCGVPVDPTYHEVVEQHPGATTQTDTVAACITPIFGWTDSKGTRQVKPAQVIAYVKPLCEPTLDPRHARNGESLAKGKH